jgi:hypothetical protein
MTLDKSLVLSDLPQNAQLLWMLNERGSLLAIYIT